MVSYCKLQFVCCKLGENGPQGMTYSFHISNWSHQVVRCLLRYSTYPIAATSAKTKGGKKKDLASFASSSVNFDTRLSDLRPSTSKDGLELISHSANIDVHKITQLKRGCTVWLQWDSNRYSRQCDKKLCIAQLYGCYYKPTSHASSHSLCLQPH